MNRPELIQASLGLGGNKEGTELGPEKIVSELDLSSSKSIENKIDRTDTPADAKNEKQISEFCEKLSREVSEVINENKLPVILGDDHSISIGSMSGTSSATESPGVIWIDAHADFNTPETSPSGNIHGMPVATALGRGRFDWGSTDFNEEDIVMIGIRDVDEEERKNLEESDVTVYTMEEVRELGIETISDKALEQLSHVENIHVSFDLDFLDRELVPGVGTPVEGGGTVEDASKIISKVEENEKLAALDIVELNPLLDKQGRTASKAVDLLEVTLLTKIEKLN